MNCKKRQILSENSLKCVWFCRKRGLFFYSPFPRGIKSKFPGEWKFVKFPGESGTGIPGVETLVSTKRKKFCYAQHKVKNSKLSEGAGSSWSQTFQVWQCWTKIMEFCLVSHLNCSSIEPWFKGTFCSLNRICSLVSQSIFIFVPNMSRTGYLFKGFSPKRLL